MEDHRALRRVTEAASTARACGRLVNTQYSLVLLSASRFPRAGRVSLEVLLPCAEMGLQKLQFLLPFFFPPSFPAPAFFPGLMNF